MPIANFRISPSVVKLEPSKDVLVLSIDADTNYLYINRLRWTPTGYDVDPPHYTGILAYETGGGWVTENGIVYICVVFIGDGPTPVLETYSLQSLPYPYYI
jgi:hypothetical protein